MQSGTIKSEAVTQAVFTVCVGDDVSAAAIEVSDSLSGTEFIGQFQEYITAERRPQFPEVLLEAPGCVALVECDRDPERALETMHRLEATFPKRLHLVAVSSRVDAEFLLRAMRAGCHEFLTRPIDQSLLKAALLRFHSAHAVEPATVSGKGSVISLYGVKGGVGTTTVAVHLAMHLQVRHHKKVLLIDHKHELGHVALHLGLKESVYHFEELVRNVNRLDSDLLDGFVTRHSSGLDVIPSPDSCGPSSETSAEAIARMMDYLRTRYDFILIDSSLQYLANLHGVLSASDQVALVCTPDVVSLRDLVRRIEHLSVVTGFSEKLRVVVNRSTSDDAVQGADIEAAARFPISVAIPNCYADLMRAVNAGEPIAPQNRGAFTQAFVRWSNQLVSTDSRKQVAAQPKRRFLFGL